MINTDKLRGAMAEKHISYQSMAKTLQISPKTFGVKMKSGVFRTDEAEKIIEVLEISEPCSIFFAQNGTHDVTTEQ